MGIRTPHRCMVAWPPFCPSKYYVWPHHLPPIPWSEGMTKFGSSSSSETCEEGKKEAEKMKGTWFQGVRIGRFTIVVKQWSPK